MQPRTQLVVNKDFQHRFIMQTVLLTFTLINILVIFVYLLLNTLPAFQKVVFMLSGSVVALELVGFALVYYLSLKASHKIAGPVFVFERQLRKMASGDLSGTINLRKGDRFHPIKDVINELTTTYRERIQGAQREAEILQQLANGTDSEPLQSAARDLAEQLSFFVTEPPEEDQNKAT